MHGLESEGLVTRTTLSVIAIVGLLVAVPNVGHGADPTRTCAKKKLTATGKKVSDKLKCFATAAGKALAVDAACLAKAETTFANAFTKAELKGGCPTTNDAASVESLVDDCVNAVQTALGTAVAKNPCLKAKLTAAAKKAASKISCSATAASKGRTADPACLAKAEATFAKNFPKKEAKGGCLTTGDVAAVEAIVDAQCVAPLVGALPLPTVTPSPTRTATPVATKTGTPQPTLTPAATPTNNGCGEVPPSEWSFNLATQNDVRANAQPAPDPALAPFCWKATVAATAQAWADGCNYMHNPNLGMLGLGENLYACASTDASCPTNARTLAAVSWGDEDISYDYASNACISTNVCQGGGTPGAPCSNSTQCSGGICQHECGHYTQIVWRSTTSTGCGVKNCTSNSPFGAGFPNWTLVVCDYEPPGNFNGQRPY
jgi:hypothetical protein